MGAMVSGESWRAPEISRALVSTSRLFRFHRSLSRSSQGFYEFPGQYVGGATGAGACGRPTVWIGALPTLYLLERRIHFDEGVRFTTFFGGAPGDLKRPACFVPLREIGGTKAEFERSRCPEFLDLATIDDLPSFFPEDRKACRITESPRNSCAARNDA